MTRATRNKKRKKRRIYGVIFIIFLLAAAGAGLYRLPPSLQDIGRIFRLAADKSNEKSADVMSAEPVLRGTVFDREMNELAVSYMLYSLHVRPAEIKDQKLFAQALSQYVSIDENTLATSLKESRNVIKIMENLDREQADRIREAKIPGVYLRDSEERFYPEHQTAAMLIGYTGENIGLKGVEGTYEMLLQQGEFRSEAVPEIDFKNERVLGRSTMDIVLTLDLEMQNRVEEQLREYLETKKASRGIALLMNPKTGGILAWAGTPSFNPNYFWQAPGATEKSLFEEQIATELFDPLLVRSAAVRKNGEQGDPLLPVTVAAPAYGLQKGEIKQYGAVIGLYKNISCYLPACEDKEQQKKGIRADSRGLSAIQIAVTAASLINGGWRITPYVLDSVFDHSFNDFFFRSDKYENAGRRRVMSPSMGIMMRRELLYQDGQNKKDNFVYFDSVAQMVTENQFSRYVIQDMMLGVIPKKSPQLMLLVISQQDFLGPLQKKRKRKKKKKKKMADRVLPELLALNEMNAERIEPNGRNLSNYNRFLISRRVDFREMNEAALDSDVTMPQVTGLSLRKGLQRLNGYRCSVRIEGSGQIVMQDPAAGASLKGTGECVLTLESKI